MIRFIKTKHSKTYFVAAKVVMNWQRQNTSYLGWLRIKVPVRLVCRICHQFLVLLHGLASM